MPRSGHGAYRRHASAAAHLGITLREYDRRIRTFIPHYQEMLSEAAAVVAASCRGRRPVLVDLGIGTGALAALCAAAVPGARIVGIDSDPDMLATARRRIGVRLKPIEGDIVEALVPPCDAIVASFALHHIRSRRVKADVYRKCARALRSGGVLVSADCCPAIDRSTAMRDREAWLAHLSRWYSSRASEAYLRAWSDEDTYQPLRVEMSLMESAGFAVEVCWRRDSFAVLAARVREGRSRGRTV